MMKSRKRTPVLAGILLAAALVAGCVMPEYMLSFDVTGASQLGSVVTVDYEMENIGRDTLSNVQMVIAVESLTGTSYSTVVTAGTLSVGESHVGSVDITISGTYDSGSARITSAGWDVQSE